jgi:glycosyltransferase involved in cell wall biosynthesis
MSKPLVLVDAGSLADGRMTGWERYTQAVVTAVAPANHDLCIEILERPKGVNRWVWEFHTLPRLARSARDSVVHFPAAPPPPYVTGPTVTTVHDATLIFRPEWGSSAGRHIYRRFLTRQRARSNAWQLTPSLAARNDLRLAGFADSRIIVASPPAYTPTGDAELPEMVADDYLLYVGTREPRKNLANLIEAVGMMDTDVSQLVIAGRAGWNAAAAPTFAGRVQVLYLGSISDGALASLYAQARAVVLPSLYEGFGLPVAEALAFGRPVVCSDIPAVREVAGAAAHYFNPRDVDSMVAALERALADDVTTVGRSGESIRDRFSPQHFLDGLLTAYRLALGVGH